MTKLQIEYDELKNKERPEVVKTVSWAASLGDRSENADYQYGKQRLREIDRRLRFLDRIFNEVEVVDPETLKFERVQFGASVKIQNDLGEFRHVAIVGVHEVDTERGFYSWKSPLGTALLGKEIGDEAVVITPNGQENIYTIIEIEYKKISFD